MVKGVMQVQVAASGQATYTPYPTGTPIVLELNQGGTIVGSALQFYTRADIRAQEIDAPPERHVLVRYYLNPNDHTLCREVNEDDSALPDNPLPLEGGGTDRGNKQLWPVALSDPSQVDANAVCDDIRAVRFLLRRWDDTSKQFIPSLTSVLQYDPGSDGRSDCSDCTHILIRLEMTDTEARNRPLTQLDANSAIIPCRTFVKVLPIPKAIQ